MNSSLLIIVYVLKIRPKNQPASLNDLFMVKTNVTFSTIWKKNMANTALLFSCIPRYIFSASLIIMLGNESYSWKHLLKIQHLNTGLLYDDCTCFNHTTIWHCRYCKRGVFIVWVKLTRSYAIILKPLKIHAPPPI